MTLTDEIYRELMDGLRTGVDYDKVRLKWEGSKGPFYNALQRVFADAATEVAQASSELNAALQASRESQQRAAALEAQERKAETELKATTDEKKLLGQQTATARKQLQKVNSQLTAKKRLLNQAGDLEEMNFGLKQLQQLHGTLVEIGTKRGLKPKEAIVGFFSDLEDYDAKVGFEREIQRLNTVAETSRLEAKKWQAEKDAIERAYRDKKDAVNAMESLLKQGVQPEHIPVWGKSVQAAGGVEGLSRDLAKYKSVRESVAAWEKEIKRLDMLRAELSGEVNALEKRRAETQGATSIMSKAGVDEIRATRQEAVSGVRAAIVEFMNEAKVHTELRVEAAKLEKELTCARYLAANDEMLQKASIDIAEILLQTVVRYCRLRGFNHRVRVPQAVAQEGVFYSYYDGVPFLELLQWVVTGLSMAKIGRRQ